MEKCAKQGMKIFISDGAADSDVDEKDEDGDTDAASEVAAKWRSKWQLLARRARTLVRLQIYDLSGSDVILPWCASRGTSIALIRQRIATEAGILAEQQVLFSGGFSNELADDLTLARVVVATASDFISTAGTGTGTREHDAITVTFTMSIDEGRSGRFYVDECGEPVFCGEWRVDKERGLHNGKPVYAKVQAEAESKPSAYVLYDQERKRTIRRSFWRMTMEGSNSQYIRACGNFDPNADLAMPPKSGWIRWRKQAKGSGHMPQPPSPVPALRY